MQPSGENLRQVREVLNRLRDSQSRVSASILALSSAVGRQLDSNSGREELNEWNRRTWPEQKNRMTCDNALESVGQLGPQLLLALIEALDLRSCERVAELETTYLQLFNDHCDLVEESLRDIGAELPRLPNADQALFVTAHAEKPPVFTLSLPRPFKSAVLASRPDGGSLLEG